jgi:hypothetical protein
LIAGWFSTSYCLLLVQDMKIALTKFTGKHNLFFFGWPGSTHLTRDPITWPGR